MFHLIGGRPALALATAERMLETGNRDNGRNLLFAGQLFAGMAEFYMGRFVVALGYLRVASELGGPDGLEHSHLGFVSDLRAMIASHQACALLATGDVAAADQADRASWTAAENSRTAFFNAGAFCFSCFYSLLRGDIAAVQRKLGPAITFCAQQSYLFWLAIAAMLRAMCIAEAGQVTEGVVMLRQALEAYRATGSSLAIACALGKLADCLTRLGRIDEALGVTAEALDTAQTNSDHWFEAELHRIQGEAFLAAGDRAAAVTSFRKAISVAQSQGATLWELRAALRLVPLLAEQHARNEAYNLLTAVLGRMPSRSAAAEIREADALLDSLRSYRSGPH
jgi:tetratricopeptide (TPR) repeat protein